MAPGCNFFQCPFRPSAGYKKVAPHILVGHTSILYPAVFRRPRCLHVAQHKPSSLAATTQSSRRWTLASWFAVSPSPGSPSEDQACTLLVNSMLLRLSYARWMRIALFTPHGCPGCKSGTAGGVLQPVSSSAPCGWATGRHGPRWRRGARPWSEGTRLMVQVAPCHLADM